MDGWTAFASYGALKCRSGITVAFSDVLAAFLKSGRAKRFRNSKVKGSGEARLRNRLRMLRRVKSYGAAVFARAKTEKS